MARSSTSPYPLAMAPESAVHYRTCNLCEAMCGIAIEHQGERVLSIKGDKADPFSDGHICPKAVALQDLQNDPDRLRTPMRRVGDRWEPLSWDDAYDLAEREIGRVRERHGRHAVATYLGNPTIHSLGATLFAPIFLRALRTKNRFSATSVDQLPHHVAATAMFGHALLLPVPDLDRTEHLLILGANPAASKGSLLSAGDVMGRIAKIRARGGKVVLIDPRRTETAAAATEHHFIRPGTDALLLASMLHVLFRKSLVTLGRLGAHSRGLGELSTLVQSFPPERVAAATGMTPELIDRLAVEFAAAPRAAAYGRIGISLQEHGSLACWLTTALNAATGRLDEVGGVMFPEPAIDVLRITGAAGYGAGTFGRWKSRVRQLPEFGGEFPVATLVDEIETPGEGQVKALITHAGNPVLSTPSGARLSRAIAGLEFYLAIDFYKNETTRHAHLILPPTGPLEREHYDVVFHGLAVRNGAKFSPAMFRRLAGARHDWEILNELAVRLRFGGRRARLAARLQAKALEALGPRGLVDLGLRAGPYGASLRPLRSGLSVGTLEASPHGIDLGPLKPRLPDVLRKRDKLVDLAPKILTDDAARLGALADASARTRLQLLGRRDLRSNNSWMHNTERLMRGRARCTLLIHPSDAEPRGLKTGSRARVTSVVGSVVIEVELTQDIMPGVVSMPHGWGHDREGSALRVASQHAGVSLNDLTDASRVDPLCGNAALNGIEVDVERMASD